MAEGWCDSMITDLALVSCFVTSVLRAAEPRCLHALDDKDPIVIFSDGACEPTADGVCVGAGIVVIDCCSKESFTCETPIPEAVVRHWSRAGKTQLVAIAELWPVLVVFSSHGKTWQGRRVLCFIDNNSIRDALLKGSSNKIDLFSMLSLISHEVAQHGFWPWYARIASKSNPGDLPSRGRAKEASERFGAKLKEPLNLDEHLQNSLLQSASFLEWMHVAARKSNRKMG